MRNAKKGILRFVGGFTLVELMVGILVSMIVVLGMVGVYRTVARNAAEVAIGTKIDNQVFSAMLAVDRILQGAGFGLPEDPAASLGSKFSVDEDSVIWFVDSARTYCNALISDSDGLRWFGPTATDPGYSCAGLSLPSVGDAAITLVQTSTVDAMEGTGEFTFSVDGVSPPCSPFGVEGTATGGGYVVTVNATVFAGNVSASNEIQNTVCMFNFK